MKPFQLWKMGISACDSYRKGEFGSSIALFKAPIDELQNGARGKRLESIFTSEFFGESAFQPLDSNNFTKIFDRCLNKPNRRGRCRDSSAKIKHSSIKAPLSVENLPMRPNIQTIQSATPIATVPIESDTALLSEGLIAIALPLGLFLGVLVRKTRQRRLLRYQIALLERLWLKSTDHVQ